MTGSGVARWRFGDDAGEVDRALRRGAVVAIPTESSYGLAVDPLDLAAVGTIFRLKRGRGERALPVVAAAIEQLVPLGVDPESPELAWAAARWPAALTIVVPLPAPIAATRGERSLAVRIPGHAELRSLLADLGRPLTATSANPSGAAPYLDPEEIAAWFATEGVDGVIVDAGRLAGGPPSTLVGWRDGALEVLRPGRVDVA